MSVREAHWMFPFTREHARPRAVSALWIFVFSFPSVTQQALEHCSRTCLVIEWTLVISLLWDLFTTLPQRGYVPERVAGLQLTSVQKGKYQAAQLSVLTTVIQLIQSLEITFPVENVAVSMAFKRRTFKAFLTLFIPQAKKGKYFFSFLFPCSSTSLSVGRLSLV